ncbi:hypothetical protein EDC01DRAFT_633754 [Geopyxis carbonaria]|nr:hypothetical protein EDC01DRAFT_633754 [Geopyxis carbonaria]
MDPRTTGQPTTKAPTALNALLERLGLKKRHRPPPDPLQRPIAFALPAHTGPVPALLRLPAELLFDITDLLAVTSLCTLLLTSQRTYHLLHPTLIRAAAAATRAADHTRHYPARTPLRWAAHHGFTALTADIAALLRHTHPHAITGALLVAAAAPIAHPSLIAALLDAGADPAAAFGPHPHPPVSALVVAVALGRCALATQLLRTPPLPALPLLRALCHIAAWRNDAAMARVLLREAPAHAWGRTRTAPDVGVYPVIHDGSEEFWESARREWRGEGVSAAEMAVRERYCAVMRELRRAWVPVPDRATALSRTNYGGWYDYVWRLARDNVENMCATLVFMCECTRCAGIVKGWSGEHQKLRPFDAEPPVCEAGDAALEEEWLGAMDLRLTNWRLFDIEDLWRYYWSRTIRRAQDGTPRPEYRWAYRLSQPGGRTGPATGPAMVIVAASQGQA